MLGRRERAVQLREAGWSNKAIADELQVHPSTVGRWFTPPVEEPEIAARDGDNVVDVDQEHEYEDPRAEEIPEPDGPEDLSEVRQAPDAVAAADVTRRKDAEVLDPDVIETDAGG